MLVAYAARDGQVAADGNGANSPYTTALLEYIETPGLEIQFMFRKVRDAVLASTGNRQQPHEYGSLGGDPFYFVPPAPVATTPAVDPRLARELAFWRSIAETRKPAELEARIEGGIRKAFGLEIAVVVRGAARFLAYLDENPFPEASAEDPAHVLLGLSKAVPARGAAAALRERAAAGERVEAVGDALWFHYPAGIGRSKLTPVLIDRLVGSSLTARNVTTVRRLAEMTGG